jgi:hypothetical protein
MQTRGRQDHKAAALPWRSLSRHQRRHAASLEKGYSAPIWLTFKQAHELGAHVRKGEHGSLVVYANTITRTETDAETAQEISFLKGYTVFNVEQIDGLPAHFYAPAQSVLDPVQRIAHAESFFANTKADIRHGGNHDCARSRRHAEGSRLSEDQRCRHRLGPKSSRDLLEGGDLQLA